MDYISCFSGIGGLEGTKTPLALCEVDPECHGILRRKFPYSVIHDDVNTFQGFKCEIVAGGWPCQDISIAGKQKGLTGKNSGMFYAFVDVAVQASAQTIIAENVPHLLRLENGNVFKEVLREFVSHGFKFCAWRLLNAREFGLPHNRNRIFIVASKTKKHCFSLFRDIPSIVLKVSNEMAAGFYWTAGTHSICYSKGYVPAIKVGSGLSIASPPAVHFGDSVRLLSPSEVLALQGFDPSIFVNLNKRVVYRMAGNAVAKPVGRFVLDGVLDEIEYQGVEFIHKQGDLFSSLRADERLNYPGDIPNSGFFSDGIWGVKLPNPHNLAVNLHSFIDSTYSDVLSKRAATGLLKRLDRSAQYCPPDLRLKLESIRDEHA